MFSNFSTFCLIILAVLTTLTVQECRNTSDTKYDLLEPAQITHYYSQCSTFTKRTCCSAKNLQTLQKKIKKAIESIDISSNCKNTIESILCSACDGDWGEGLYNGICGSYCYTLYQDCMNDLFVLEANNKLRACKEEDLFCWKLKDIFAHHYLDFTSPKASAQVCTYFDLAGTEQEVDCWKGQISSQIRGKGKQKIDYTAVKKVKRVRKPWFQDYSKQAIYSVILLGLVVIVVYKWCRPRRRQVYYKLN